MTSWPSSWASQIDKNRRGSVYICRYGACARWRALQILAAPIPPSPTMARSFGSHSPISKRDGVKSVRFQSRYVTAVLSQKRPFLPNLFPRTGKDWAVGDTGARVEKLRIRRSVPRFGHACCRAGRVARPYNATGEFLKKPARIPHAIPSRKDIKIHGIF